MTPRASVAAAFGLHAVLVGTLAPRLPAIKADTGATDGDLGLAFTGLALGLVVGTRIAEWAMPRWTSRRVVRAGIVLMAAAHLGIAGAGDVGTLMATMVLAGVTSGVTDVSMNTQAVDVERAHGRSIMSGIHAVWGLGMLTGGLLATGFVALGASVLLHFAVIVGAVVVAAAVVLRALLPRDERPEIAPGAAVGRGAVALLGLVTFAALIGEGALAEWSAIYLDDVVGAGRTLAAMAFTAFALGLTVSRLLMDRVVRRFGPVRVVRVAALAAAAGLGLGLAVPEPATALLSCALFGVAMAPIVPLAFSAAGNLGRAGALGWVVAAGYGGMMIGPALIGLLSEASSLRTALLLVVACALLIAPMAGRVRTAVG